MGYTNAWRSGPHPFLSSEYRRHCYNEVLMFGLGKGSARINFVTQVLHKLLHKIGLISNKEEENLIKSMGFKSGGKSRRGHHFF